MLLYVLLVHDGKGGGWCGVMSISYFGGFNIGLELNFTATNLNFVSFYLVADFDGRYFWNWTDFRSYVEFIAAFTLTASLITYLLLGYVIYVEALGFTSLLIEAMLGVPQFYDNYVSKSTYGMRYSL